MPLNWKKEKEIVLQKNKFIVSSYNVLKINFAWINFLAEHTNIIWAFLVEWESIRPKFYCFNRLLIPTAFTCLINHILQLQIHPSEYHSLFSKQFSAYHPRFVLHLGFLLLNYSGQAVLYVQLSVFHHTCEYLPDNGSSSSHHLNSFHSFTS